MNKALDLEKGSDFLHSIAGIHLVGKALAHCSLEEVFSDTKRKGFRFQDVDVIKSLVGALAQGREKFTDISQFRNDPVFHKSLGLKAVPSEESVRQRIEAMPEKHNEKLNKACQNLLKGRSFGAIERGGMKFIPVDLDVSPFDNSGSKREQVSYTYKKFMGYAPMLGYIGTEGYMLLNELRPGSQHSQKGMPEVLDRLARKLNDFKLEHPALIRLDSAHDAEENFKYLPQEHFFLIKRNLRRESREQWLDMARSVGRNIGISARKNTYVGTVHHRLPGNKQGSSVVTIVFRVTEFLENNEGQALLIPELKVETWWTNLPLQAEDVIELYCDHGTSEQFHSEMKTDLNVERLPSGKFRANQLYLNCAMLAFNVLRMIGQLLISNKELAPVKIKSSRRRLRTVIRDLIFCACKYVRHSKRELLKFGRHCPWFEVFVKISRSL